MKRSKAFFINGVISFIFLTFFLTLTVLTNNVSFAQDTREKLPSNLLKVHIRAAFFAPLNSQVKKVQSYRGDLQKPAKITSLREVFFKPELEMKNGERLLLEEVEYLHIKMPAFLMSASDPDRAPRDDD